MLIDDYTWRRLALHVSNQIQQQDVIDILAETMVTYSVPAYLCSDNDPGMEAKNLRRRIASANSKPLMFTSHEFSIDNTE